MHPLNTSEEIKMKQIEYFGKIYDVKEDAVLIGINSFYQVFTKNNKCEYTFIELRNDLIGKFNVLPQTMTIVSGEHKSHPHADLMLKYAMIAQYDDKPWENFEVLLDGEWVDCEHEGLYAGIEYRLKPQEPKIQVGQVWVSREGVEVNINRLANKLVFTEINIGGLTIPWSFKQNQFFSNFKLKENK